MTELRFLELSDSLLEETVLRELRLEKYVNIVRHMPQLAEILQNALMRYETELMKLLQAIINKFGVFFSETRL